MSTERTSDVRVAIIYRDRLLRDLAVSLLRDAPVDLVGCVEAGSYLPKDFESLQPSVVILDHAASQVLASNDLSGLFLCERHGIIRLVVIGLEETRMIVVQRQVMDTFDGDQFIASTLGTNSANCSPSAWFHADRVHSI